MAERTTGQATARPPMPGPRESRPPPAKMRRPPAARVAMAHGAYLAAFGLWPILHMPTFKRLTGPKPEAWLAKGVGACMANVGAALAAAGARGKVAREVRVLGITTGISFAAMDIWYAGFRRRISPVYLLNAAAHLGFIAAWAYAELRERRERRSVPEAAFA